MAQSAISSCTFTAMLKSETPSPAEYYVEEHNRSPKFTMHIRPPILRSEAERSEVSPCSYQENRRFAPEMPQITISSRPSVSKKAGGPGPDSYSPNYHSFGTGRKSSLSSRVAGAECWLEKYTRNSPSPNAYCIKSKMTKAGYVFNKTYGTKKQEVETSPGPAYLDITKAFKKEEREKSPSLAGRIDSVQEKQRNKSSNIGPGSYNLPSSFEKRRGVTISGRTKIFTGVM